MLIRLHADREINLVVIDTIYMIYWNIKSVLMIDRYGAYEMSLQN